MKMKQEWNWKKEFHDKFDKEIHYAVIIQLEKFISKVRCDAVVAECEKSQKMIKNLTIK